MKPFKVVERTFAWLSQFRRLRVRYDKRADIHQAFVSLVCALICWQSLRKTWIGPELVPRRFP
jgi:transposase